jgi:ribosomal protein S18 acetylase RimI-like enzyme
MNGTENPRITIREAVPGQDEGLISSLRESVGWSAIETGLVSMAAGRSVVFVLELDSRPAASGALIFKSDDPDLADGRKTGLISNLIVHSDFQNHGLGSRLLEFLEDQGRHRGLTMMTIGVDAPNVKARALYERHGYQAFKERIEAWGPVVYLRRTL